METGVLTMAEAAYRRAEGISKSDLDWICPPRTPAHYKARRDGLVENVQTPAMRLGSLVHRAVLEPDTMAGAYVVKPEGMLFTTKEGKAWKAEQTAPIITQDEADQIHGMVRSVWAHPMAKRILHNAKTEQCLFAEDEHGTIRKARLDALVGGSVIPDLKTSASADPQEFERSLGKFRYHVQAAYYIDLCRLVGIDKSDFVFIVVEKEAPHATAVYSLSQDAIDLGRMEYQRDLAAVRECTEKNQWPGFTEEITVIGLPAWMQKQAEGLL
jgi:hypothetical protein